ncbi:CBS domain-containing protein [Pseudonocardiaceae bacterium YIM PH 21723]|nr:CBS domain-containing protein [Pseudonocardiaceae bacterium YIM PH 21723]
MTELDQQPSPAVLLDPAALKFVCVGELVPDDQEMHTVPPGTRADEALALMQRHRFDRLPVVTANGRVIGVFTYRSFAQNLHTVRPQDNPLTLPVEDFVEDLLYVRSSEGVGEVLDDIEADGAVLVGHEDALNAIVTASDISRFLWSLTRPFVLLRDIELAIRGLMKSCCTEEQLTTAAAQVSLVDIPGRAVLSRLEHLTLGELLSVLLHGPNYGLHFRHAFGANRTFLHNLLEPIREIRNKVFHFRDEVTEADIQQLADVRVWLRRKVSIRGGCS